MLRLFQVYVPVGAVALFVSEAMLAASCFAVASFFLLAEDPWVVMWEGGGLLRLAPVVGSILLGLYVQDLYSRIRVGSRIGLAFQLCVALGIALVAEGLISYGVPDLRLPVALMVSGTGMCLVVLFAWRLAFSLWVLPVVGAQRVLLVGEGDVLKEVAGYVARHPELGWNIEQHLEDRDAGRLREVTDVVRPDRVVVGLAERRGQLPLGDLLELRLSGTVVEEAAAAYEELMSRVCISQLRPLEVLLAAEGPHGRPARLVRSGMSWTVALCLALVCLPVMAAVALALWPHGRVLARRARAGWRGVPFIEYRFAIADGVWWARLARRLGLDRTPQLFNVVKGEMAMVGPAPARPEFVQEIGSQVPFYRQRLVVKPGITGWAQVQAPGLAEETRSAFEYDLYYLKNASPTLDALILLRALKILVVGRGTEGSTLPRSGLLPKSGAASSHLL